MKRLLTACLAVLALAAVAAIGASAADGRSRSGPMLLGVMDDALLGNVPDIAFADVEQLRPQVIRYDLSWAHTAPRKPAVATDPNDPAYDWARTDQVVAARGCARHSRGADDRGHAEVGGRRHRQQAAGQHGAAAGLRLRRRHALQRAAHRPVDRAGAARRHALGGLERAQHHEPPEAAVQLPLRLGRAGLAAHLREDPQGDLHGRPLRRDARGSHRDRRRRRHEAQLLRARRRTSPPSRRCASCRSSASTTRRSTSTPTTPTARTPARRRARSRTRTTSRSPTCRASSRGSTRPSRASACTSGSPSSACRRTRRTASRASASPTSRSSCGATSPRRARIRASTCWSGS